MFPPHTRGSTDFESNEWTGDGVSPAYAGIDRTRSPAWRRSGSFPRIRGDRPRARAPAPPARSFPPHTRGSTVGKHDKPVSAVVSPAYAGIDLLGGFSKGSEGSFPRIRGDRPGVGALLLLLLVFPPHTRGSTVSLTPRSGLIGVSPAYAGIDRSSKRSWRGSGRFPRIRGDRPHGPEGTIAPAPFPPHTRGSTARAAAPGGARAVSPAYAGIDRASSCARRRASCFPRIRGDRPESRKHASRYLLFPPHTRGSTCKTASLRVAHRVSPAYAGIDRAPRPASRAPSRFPRIRGDRPRIDCPLRPTPAFPPHTRGSTL